MNLERYPVKSKRNKKWFEFYSKGPKGVIKKVVKFERLQGNIYNLAFGDWDNKSKTLDCTARSNNGDRDKIFATIALVVMEFMKRHPGAILHARGALPGKTRLYQMAINKHLAEISYLFSIEGFRGYYWENFQTGRNYDAFALKNFSKN